MAKKPLLQSIYRAEYTCWHNMRQRCENPKATSYDRYGGRGVKVCFRWRSSFALFLEDMGPRPSPKHSLDRIENSGNYEPDNCRWATPAQQQQNRSNGLVPDMKKLHPNVIQLLADIEAYRALTGEDRTAFGLGALNDGNFISRVEHGRQPSFSTIDRVYRYIEARSKAVRKRATR